MELLLCNRCIYGKGCYTLYAGDDCKDFAPLNEKYPNSVVFPVSYSYIQSCSTLEEHNQMVALQEAYEDMKGSDLELEEYPF
ncbi:MAG: hypothetical protein ACRDD7_12515 [Peptostreptococcaceae bacterium]